MAEKKFSKVPKMKKLSAEVKSEKSMDYKFDPRPTFDVDASELPQIKDWKVGEEYSIEIKVKMESLRSSIDHQSGKEKTTSCLRVTSIGVDEDSDESKE